MAKKQMEKHKLLYILKILKEDTNEQNRLTAAEIIEKLGAYGIEAERKSVYRDLDVLEDMGYNVIRGRSGIFLSEQTFEVAELKMLADAVQASRFLTKKKSNELVEKLTGLTDKYEAAQLRRSVYINDRPKTDNEAIYYTVDAIYSAMSQNKMISFRYFDRNVRREQVLRRNGAVYTVSPWGLLRDDENYYLLAYDARSGIMKHYRTDKITGITAQKTPREGQEIFQAMDVSAYAKKMFGMFSGEEVTVTLRCENSMAGIIFDRFGTEVPVYPGTDGHFTTSVRVNVSNNFFSWVLQFGRRIKITAPADVKEQMKKLLEDAYEVYR